MIPGGRTISSGAVKTCTHHARCCDSCFTSLAAFDAHRVGGECWANDVDWVEHDGVCKISQYDPETAKPIVRHKTVHELPVSDAERERLTQLRQRGVLSLRQTPTRAVAA